jgi:hypothetical protein
VFPIGESCGQIDHLALGAAALKAPDHEQDTHE